jgi:glutaredoxin
MPTIVFYTKPGCHLCDEARAHLEELATQRELDLREVDIRRDPAIFDRYRYRIPVITVDGAERLEGRIEANDILHLLDPAH